MASSRTRAPNLLHPWATEFEDNYVAGVGYQNFPFAPTLGGLRFGGEAGISVRGGSGAVESLEAWAAFVLRYDGIVFGPIRVTPSFSAGLSAVTGTLGIEDERVRSMPGGNGHLLFYLGPELNLSLVDHPEYEAFIRLQHRSGGNQTLGNLFDGANALVGGVRYRF